MSVLGQIVATTLPIPDASNPRNVRPAALATVAPTGTPVAHAPGLGRSGCRPRFRLAKLLQHSKSRYLSAPVGYNEIEGPHAFTAPCNLVFSSTPAETEESMQLLKRLVQRGILQADVVPKIIELHNATPSKPLHELIVDQGFAKEEDVLPTLAEDFGMDLVDLTQITVEPETFKEMPLKLVHRRNLMPLSRHNGTLVVATSNPFDLYALDELRTLTGLHNPAVLASRAKSRADQDPFRRRRRDDRRAMMAGAPKRSNCSRASRLTTARSAKMAQEASVVGWSTRSCIEAANERASDIHIEREETGLRIRYRIDGILQTQPMPPEISRFQAAIISRIKIMARLNIAEKRLPQDGRIKLRCRAARSTSACRSSP